MTFIDKVFGLGTGSCESNPFFLFKIIAKALHSRVTLFLFVLNVYLK